MSAAGYCYDNAFAESAFASLKSELLHDGQPFASKQDAQRAIFDYLETIARLFAWFPILRALPALLSGLGPRPEHIRSTQT